MRSSHSRSLTAPPYGAVLAYRDVEESRQQRSRERYRRRRREQPSVTFLHHPERQERPFGNDFTNLCCSAAKIGLGQFNRSAQVDLGQKAVERRVGIDRTLLPEAPTETLQSGLSGFAG